MDSSAPLHWLSQHCRNAVVAEKWLLVEHLRVGQQWKDRLTRSGTGHVNLHAKTMRLVVNQLAAPELTVLGLVPITSDGLVLLIDDVVQELTKQKRLNYFLLDKDRSIELEESQRSDASDDATGLSAPDGRTFLRAYVDWRLAGGTLEQLNAETLEVPEKAADLSLIFATIRQRLATNRQADYADCVQAIREALGKQRCTIPRELILLQPESFPLSKCENDLLMALESQGVAWHKPNTIPERHAAELESIRMASRVAIGEINEVRGIFQQCMADANASLPLDTIEILVSDYSRYAPLLLEGLQQWLPTDSDQENVSTAIDHLPITFAEGIACIYSRPGRLLRSWIRWSQSDYLQSKAVQILREGLLIRPKSAEQVGYARLASTLRRVAIGFGLERYRTQTESERLAARRAAESLLERDPDFKGDCGSSDLQAVLATIDPLVSLAARAQDSPIALLEAARELLASCARAESAIDRYARAKLIDDIDSLLSLLNTSQSTPSNALTNIRAWLEELPVRSRILASTPRAGCVHVTPIEQGGACGRPHLFVLGMDDRKFPRKQQVDPILLDAERRRVSPDFVTAEHWTNHHHAALDRVLSRLHGVPNAEIVFSRTLVELNDDSECYASQALSRLKLPTDSQPVSFVAALPEDTLTTSEDMQRGLLGEADAALRWEKVKLHFPRIDKQLLAKERQLEATFTAYDGWVPDAGHDLLASTTTRPMSPSRLETLGSCPRKFFFARALGIVPPDEWQVDTDRWLTAMDMGTLLHDLFEEFLRELQARGETPDPQMHSHRLNELLEAKIADTLVRIPSHNPEAFRRQHDDLLDFCEIFLQKEHDYARQRDARPWVMEASLGSLAHSQHRPPTELDTDQPIVIPLRSGRTLQLCGRIDRIDRLGDDHQPRYLIWDYKTGSNFGFDQGNAIQQGRKLQPLLYVRMLAARFAALGRDPRSIAGFGYFFPSPRCEGLRYEWTVDQLLEGERDLELMLDLLSAGTFIATTEKSDCGYCDYQRVCGSAEQLVTISNWKTENPDNKQLSAWRSLRQERE